MRTKTLEQYTAQDFAGLQIDQLSKLRNGNITFNQIKWFNNLTFEQRESLMDMKLRKSFHLELIFPSRNLVLDACGGGAEELATTKEVFLGNIDDDFKVRGIDINKQDISTKEQVVDVYQVVGGATFSQMFGFFEVDLDKICLTRSQITNFCKKYPHWIGKERSGVFFLLKNKDQFYVVCVYVVPVGLGLVVHSFEYGLVWDVENRFRVVIPRFHGVFSGNS